jgi:hypothetical protein
MMPVQAIAMLDGQIARHGETLLLLTVAAGVPVEPGTTVRGFVRGYKPEQIIAGGDIKQNDRMVVLSPTGLPALPAVGSKVRIRGKIHNVQSAYPIRLADTLVRVELQVRG